MKRAILTAAVTTVLSLGAVGFVAAQQGAPPPQGGEPDMGMMLIEGLRKTKGCLGVDAGQMMSGKNSIIAWFRNKAAVVRWYESDVHMGLISNVVADGAAYGHKKPLEHVKDDKSPIMVIATITQGPQKFKDLNMPVSQISIELYAPLPGGAHLGGRLAPETFKVPHMIDYTPEDTGG